MYLNFFYVASLKDVLKDVLKRKDWGRISVLLLFLF